MAVLQKYEAIQFHRPMERGFTSPFLITAEHEESGEKETLVVKSRAGYKNRQSAIFLEIQFTTLLAQGLGVHTPEPVVVNSPEGFEFGAADYETSHQLIKKSYGLNFATIHLGKDWKTWGAGKPQKIPTDDTERIYSFDALVQNADRKADNPNLLWKGTQIVALDFDRAFAYIDSHSVDKAWREVIAMLQIKEHVLYSELKHTKAPTGQCLWDDLEEWSLHSQAKDLIEAEILQSPLALEMSKSPSLQHLYRYFTSLLRDPKDFFDYLTAHSQQ